MHFKGMTDWRAVELEDIDWDVFGGSGDHIVPYQGVELLVESSAPGDSQKRPRHGLEDDVGKNMCRTEVSTKTVLLGEEAPYHQIASSFIPEGSRSHTFNIVPTLCDLGCIANTTASPPYNVRTLDSCLSESNSIARNVIGLSSLETDQKARDNDLPYYNWPDLSNFEDIDKMFRTWDSTFGHDQNGTTDELSWFSFSTSTIYGSEIAFAPGFQSPSSDLGLRHAKLESHCPNANFLPKNVPETADHNKPTSANYADWSGTDASPKAKSVGKEKEKHFVGSSSSSFSTNLDPHVQMEFGPPVHQLPVAQITSSFEIEQGINNSSSYKVSEHVVNHPIQCLDRLPDQLYMPQATTGNNDSDDLYQREQLFDRMAAEHSHQPAFQSKVSVQEKLLKTINDTEMEDPCLELPMVESAHRTTQEISGMTSVSSDNISEKITSFQQLQDVMYQLDVRTKFCIRDSLYRLASSAKQRHGFILQNCGKGATDTKGIQASEASKRSAELMNAEANTNPIDRSIAHLLFHKPLEPATQYAYDAKSLESGIMVGGPISNRVGA